MALTGAGSSGARRAVYFFGALGGLLFGYDTGVISGAILAVAQTFPVLLEGFGAGPVFLGYAVIGVLAFLFVSSFVTETKGRSLEEIETDLQASSARA